MSDPGRAGARRARRTSVHPMATEKSSSLLILGASGDLAARLLMPGLAGLLTHEPDRRVQLVGAGVEDLSDAEWKARVKESFASVKAKGPGATATLKSTKYIKADVTAKDDLDTLVKACDQDPAIYFALPPAITELACAQLQKIDLPRRRRWPSRSPSAPTSAARRSSTRCCRRSCPKTGSTGSTTSWAGRRC